MLSEYAVSQALLKNGACNMGTSDDELRSRVRGGAVRPMVLLVSPDAALILRLQHAFSSLGLGVDVAVDVDTGMAAIEEFGLDETGLRGPATGSFMQSPAVVLLDARLPGVGNGRLLASVQESGVHQRCAVALIAEQVSDDWILRLREGVIDDIVPRDADAATLRTHISTMQRGHILSRELEQLRELAALDLGHDRVTGAFTEEAIMSILFRETDRVQRLHGALSLMLIGIGDFGHWQAELGQATCDGLLWQVAGRMRLLLRSYDVLGRKGDAEFLILLPGCSTINAVTLAERVRMEVFAEPFLIDEGKSSGTQVRLTANFGISASRGRSPVVVLREVEETLALAKQDGPENLRCAGELRREFAESESNASLYPNGEMLVR